MFLGVVLVKQLNDVCPAAKASSSNYATRLCGEVSHEVADSIWEVQMEVIVELHKTYKKN
jgi:hypothetical protein